MGQSFRNGVCPKILVSEFFKRFPMCSDVALTRYVNMFLKGLDSMYAIISRHITSDLDLVHIQIQIQNRPLMF